MSLQKITTMLGFATALFVSAHAARATVIVDFEAPLYTAGSSINGVDGWSLGTLGLVTSGSTSPAIVLSGSQSVTFTSFNYAKRQFTGSPTFSNGDTFSTLMRLDPTAGFLEYGTFYLSDDIPGSATPGGGSMYSIGAGATDAVFVLEGFGGQINTGVPFTKGDTYRIDMIVTFSNGVSLAGYTAYATNVTLAGSPVLLGSHVMNTSVTAANFSSTGGLIPYSGMNDGVSFDDLSVTPVPEPASMALLAAGAAFVLRRRRA